MVIVSRLTSNPNIQNYCLISIRRGFLQMLLMGLVLASTNAPALEPSAPSVYQLSEQDSPLEQILGQTLLLSLANVSPIFSANYHQLVEWRHKTLNSEERDKLSQMQQQLDHYWLYLDTQAECNTPCVSAASIPKDQYYLAVILKLKQLMQQAETTSWDTLILEDKLSPGQESPLIEPIKWRLFDLGFLPDKLKTSSELTTESETISPQATTHAESIARPELAESDNNLNRYDDELVSAIKAFQRQHGLLDDGVIGKQTLYWLNQSPFVRAQLLAKNTLRQQIFTRTLPSNYLLINIPAFELQLVEEGKVTLDSRVIVGKASRPTPLLNSQIASVVLNPQWRVPRSIINRDILPHIRHDGHYLQDRGFDVYDYDGTRVEHSPQEWQALAAANFPYRLVQRPGEKNALGRYKFHFDNSFSVYLHGTSEPSLFKKTNRALSSGCIRVEKVEELARWFQTHLVKDTRLWDKLMSNTTQSQWFALSETLPVYTVYWTSWLDEHGKVQYRNDIYQLEADFNLAVTASIFHIL